MTAHDDLDTTLRSIARRVTRFSPSLEEDALQEARLMAWQKAEEGATVALQVHAARMAAIDVVRGPNHKLTVDERRERAAVSLDAFLAPDADHDEPPRVRALEVRDHADDVEVSVDVSRAVRSLSRVDEELVCLVFWGGWTFEEAGAQVGYSREGVRSRWKRHIRPALRAALEVAA